MACGNKDNFSGCEKTSTVKDAGQEMEEIKKKKHCEERSLVRKSQTVEVMSFQFQHSDTVCGLM